MQKEATPKKTPKPKSVGTTQSSTQPVSTQMPKTIEKPNTRILRPLMIVLSCFVMGLLGAATYVALLGNGSTKLVEERKSLLVKEDSAVITVAKDVSPSVVSITTSSNVTDFFGQVQNEASSGTGIVLKADGLILTNKHVVEGGDNFTVITSDGKEYKGGKVVAKDPSNDIAFLKIDAKGLTPARLGDSAKVEVGQRVIAIGNALGQFQNTVTTGVISGKSRPITASGGNATENLQNLFQTDAAINPGNSGGPLVNILGEVIGINTAVAGDGAQNIGFAIPINEAKKDIASVSNGGKIVRAYLGVRYVAVTADIATRNDLGVNTIGGALIAGGNGRGVVSGSPADKAGLQDGDVIIKINNTTLDKNNPLSSVVSDLGVGDNITITVVRDGKVKTLKTQLAEAPTNS